MSHAVQVRADMVHDTFQNQITYFEKYFRKSHLLNLDHIVGPFGGFGFQEFEELTKRTKIAKRFTNKGCALKQPLKNLQKISKNRNARNCIKRAAVDFVVCCLYMIMRVGIDIIS